MLVGEEAELEQVSGTTPAACAASDAMRASLRRVRSSSWSIALTASLPSTLHVTTAPYTGSASTSMNLMSASHAILSCTNALQRTCPVRLFTRTVDRFQDQLVPGHDRVPHLHLIHAQQHRKLAGVLELLAQQQPAELGHRLDDQHAGHDRRAGVMALEEDVVERDVLDADGLSRRR